MTEIEMKEELLKDFVLYKECSAEQIEKYKGKVPDFLIDIWENYGLGTFKDGYLRTINPDEYIELLNDTYFAAARSIPIFTTAFGDILTFETGREGNFHLYNVKYRRGNFNVIPAGIQFFYKIMNSESFIAEYLDYEQYPAAVEKLGVPPYNQCFCYVPILGMGGSEKVENIELGDTKTHIEVITHFMGGI